MYEAIAEIILVNERSDHRFENFCLRVAEIHDGVTFVPTSQSWDLGRDARSGNRAKGSHANILCATLNEDLDAKVEADLLRLTSQTSPDRIIYCSSQKLSEHRIDNINLIIRRHTPQGSILILSAIQLAKLASDNQLIFEKFYGAELKEIRSTILLNNSGRVPSNGLRLALLTFGSAEGAGLRDEVLHTTILDRLSLNESLSIQQICVSFSRDVGLPKTLPESFLLNALNQASAEGDVIRQQDGWRLTEAGEAKRNSLPIEAAQHLLEGRRIVRDRLEALIGKSIADAQYSALWSGLIDSLGAMFHASGLEIVKAIEQVLEHKAPSGQPLDLKKLLEGSMKRTVSIVATPELRDSIYRALLDLFTEREGEGFNWLTRVAERFVTLCAIGLENSSGDAVRETLALQRVVLDSDIILNFLCSAEPDHLMSRDLLVGWLGIGGKILVSPIVLEEVAHNAWISDRDFRETETLLGKLSYKELGRYINSPFVRTFHTLKASSAQWPIFIGQFRGNSPGDYSRILLLLKQRLMAETLPATFDSDLRDRISEYLSQLPSSFGRDSEQLEDVTYKINRDGGLLASIASARQKNELAGTEASIVLLSSSGTLRLAELKFQAEFGDARLVLHKRAFSYLLASIPQAALGADTLRRALFDFGSHGRLRSHDRTALRIIRSTGLYDMPWAERVTLRQQLSKSIKAEADRRGLNRKQMQDSIAGQRSPEMIASVLVEAVQNLAIPTSVEIALAESKQKIVELEQRLAEIKSGSNPTVRNRLGRRPS